MMWVSGYPPVETATQFPALGTPSLVREKGTEANYPNSGFRLLCQPSPQMLRVAGGADGLQAPPQGKCRSAEEARSFSKDLDTGQWGGDADR